MLRAYKKVSENLNNKRTVEKYFLIDKNEDKIAGDHLKLNFYYINKKQKLVVMYLELIFTGIKSER